MKLDTIEFKAIQPIIKTSFKLKQASKMGQLTVVYQEGYLFTAIFTSNKQPESGEVCIVKTKL